jgi:hypothetical protein
MNAPPDLHVRLSIREALTRIGDASGFAADDVIVARLQSVKKELEDILAQLAPDPAPFARRVCSWTSTGD